MCLAGPQATRISLTLPDADSEELKDLLTNKLNSWDLDIFRVQQLAPDSALTRIVEACLEVCPLHSHASYCTNSFPIVESTVRYIQYEYVPEQSICTVYSMARANYKLSFFKVLDE